MGLLILVRHGQASFGARDYDLLSELGHQQARLAGARLAGAVPADVRLVSGTMVRQRDTAADLGLGRAEYDPRLNEYDHDAVIAAHAVALAGSGSAPPTDPADALVAAITWWGGGGEPSHDEFTARVSAVTAELAAAPGVTVAVSSGGVIAVAAAAWLGMPAGSWPIMARVLTNASVSKVITGRTGTWLQTLNDHAHLEHDRSLITYR